MPRCRPPDAELRRDDPAEEIEKPARRCVMQSGRVVMSVFASILLIGGRGCPPPAESRWNETVKRWLYRQGGEASPVLWLVKHSMINGIVGNTARPNA